MKFLQKYGHLIFIFSMLITCGTENLPDKGNSDENDDETPVLVWYSVADSSSNSLITNFWNTNGKYFNTNNAGDFRFQYWPNAHALDVLVDAYLRSHDPTYRNYFGQWFEGVKQHNGNSWRNNYYDDMEWIALALLRTYQTTSEAKYKEAALKIWEYIKEGWNDSAGGGIAWKKGMEYSKNACSNGPAAILAARLYQEFGKEEDKEWAVNIYNWLKTTLVDPNTGAVWDSMDSRTGTINKSWIFTYNQGTYIGAAVELHKIFNEKSYLNDAQLTADYTINALVNNSILKNEGVGDGGLFKGIFVRYFTQLIMQERLDPSVRRHYLQFMKLNAETLWNQGTYKPTILFGPDWTKKAEKITGLKEQLSGCMLMEATALLEKEGLLYL